MKCIYLGCDVPAVIPQPNDGVLTVKNQMHHKCWEKYIGEEIKEIPLVAHVYRRMLKQAIVYGQKSRKETTESEKEIYEELSNELMHWCSELEKTPEVKP